MRLGIVCASILIAAGVTSSSFGGEAFDAIDGCVKRLDPQTDVGYERIAARCPDLTRRLDATSWAPWLPRSWKSSNNDLSARSLTELRALVERELAAQPTSRTPKLGPLTGILAELGPPESRQAGLWTRFTRWLREALERGDQSSSGGWLARVTARVGPSQAVIELICYGCLAVVVALAVGVIVNELRVWGVLAARRGKAGTWAHASTTSDWSVIQSAPMRERPRVLLELIAFRLTELNRLPAAGGLTVRELLQTARFTRGEDRSLLADVALAAERVRFSAEPIPDAALLAAVEQGRRLLEHLEP